MKRIEIKLNKRGHVIMVVIYISVIIFSVWGITHPDVELWVKGILGVFISLFLWHSYKILIVIDEPVITLTKTTIQLNTGKNNDIFLWSDITDYTVHYKKSDEGVEYTLTLFTNAKSQTFHITGISKMPDELKKIINDFRGTVA